MGQICHMPPPPPPPPNRQTVVTSWHHWIANNSRTSKCPCVSSRATCSFPNSENEPWRDRQLPTPSSLKWSFLLDILNEVGCPEFSFPAIDELVSCRYWGFVIPGIEIWNSKFRFWEVGVDTWKCWAVSENQPSSARASSSNCCIRVLV